MLAAGWSPVYPCHVSPRDLRSHPIGTGPFKFVEFRPNEYIRVARNPDYWKPGRPYLDGIEWTIVPSLGTRILGFIAGKFDQVFGVTIPLLRDLKSQAPQAVCDMFPANLPRTLLVNRTRPPFDSPELRRAMAFSLDQQAFIDIEEQPERGPHAMVRLLARVVGIGIETADMLVNEVHMGRLDEAREAVERLRSLTNVVVPSAAHWRSPENRELYLSGLRLAAGETK